MLDLDDTLYLERDYVRSGFREVARHLSAVADVAEGEVFESLWEGFLGGVRGDAFDRLLERFPQPAGRATVADLVEVYRRHRPEIGLAEPAAVSRLADSGVALALISDGFPAAQRAKLSALGLDDMFDPAIVTDEWGVEFRKPHHRAFEEVELRLSLPAHELTYVADNPRKDFIAPNQRGWGTARLRMPGQLHETVEPGTPGESAARELGSLHEIVDFAL